MASIELGRLQRVELREVWTTESSGFTPWLASDENIIILSEAVGIDLEVVATEKDVGPFRADILCRDINEGSNAEHFVLIENQLERTDHTHLGQLLTYAAGLNAATIIWIAPKFTDEHRAALDWLNQITDGRFRFFGLEIELWRIGDSPAAPKFNVLCRPNDWTQAVSLAARQSESKLLSDTQKLQLDYWTQFREELQIRASDVRGGHRPRPQSYMRFSFKRRGIELQCMADFRNYRLAVAIVLKGLGAENRFQILLKEKLKIESEIGAQLDWNTQKEMSKERRVYLRNTEMNPNDKPTWQQQHQWLAEGLEKFSIVFGSRLEALDSVILAIATDDDLT